MSVFSVPAKIITGEQALCEAMPFLKAMGARPLVVTGRHTAASPFFCGICGAFAGKRPVLCRFQRNHGRTYRFHDRIGRFRLPPRGV